MRNTILKFNILCAFLIASFFSYLSAQVAPEDQEVEKKNIAYLELFGNGVLYSINYERMISENLSARIGGAFYKITADTPLQELKSNVVIAPLMLNRLIGSTAHKLELGLGLDLCYVKVSLKGSSYSNGFIKELKKGFAAIPTSVIGYRYQDKFGGPVIRFGVMPSYALGSLGINLGLSLGAAF